MEFQPTLSNVLNNPNQYTMDEIMSVLYREVPDLHDKISEAIEKGYLNGWEACADSDGNDYDDYCEVTGLVNVQG